MSKIGAASVNSDSGAPLLSALASCAAVLAWLQFFFLAPLKDEASDHVRGAVRCRLVLLLDLLF